MQPRHCKICGEEIPRRRETPSRYAKREICPPSIDQKKITCFSRLMSQSNEIHGGYKNGKRPNKTYGARLDKASKRSKAAKVPRMSEAEVERLDMEQFKINIVCHIRDMERCGYNVPLVAAYPLKKSPRISPLHAANRSNIEGL